MVRSTICRRACHRFAGPPPRSATGAAYAGVLIAVVPGPPTAGATFEEIRSSAGAEPEDPRVANPVADAATA
jgi:hypothetical protein